MEQSNALGLYISSAPHCQSICVITHSHLHRAFTSHSSIPAVLSQSISWKDNMALLRIYNTAEQSKSASILTQVRNKVWSHSNFYLQVYKRASHGSVNIMTRMAGRCPFVANILSICPYQLSVLLSDTLLMFKVRLETPGGFQGSDVCTAAKQWNRWHRAKWRGVRVPLYCDSVALNSSVSSWVTAPAAQITWICATSLLQELQIKIRQQDVDTVYTHVPRSPRGKEAFAWYILSKCRSWGTTSAFCSVLGLSGTNTHAPTEVQT